MKPFPYLDKLERNISYGLMLFIGSAMIVTMIIISQNKVPLAWNIVTSLTGLLLIGLVHSRTEYINKKREKYVRLFKQELMNIYSSTSSMVSERENIIMICPYRSTVCENKCSHERPHIRTAVCLIHKCVEVGNDYLKIN